MSKLRFDLGRETFSDLRLRQDPAARVLVCEGTPLERVLDRNGFGAGTLLTLRAAALEEMVLSWYLFHVSHGGRCSMAATEAVMMLRTGESTVRLTAENAAARKLEWTTASAVRKAFGALGWMGGTGMARTPGQVLGSRLPAGTAAQR